MSPLVEQYETVEISIKFGVKRFAIQLDLPEGEEYGSFFD